MSRFTDFLKEAMMAEPGASNNYTSGNVSNKSPMLKSIPSKNEESEEDSIQSFINTNDIKLDKENVETIIAIVDKTLDDYNREKKLDGNEIEKVVLKAIEDNLIEVK